MSIYTDSKTGKFRPGNPGKPKGTINLLSVMKRKLEEIPAGEKVSNAELMINQMIKKAIKGNDFATQKLILNYLIGMPRQVIENVNEKVPDHELSEADKNDLQKALDELVKDKAEEMLREQGKLSEVNLGIETSKIRFKP